MYCVNSANFKNQSILFLIHSFHTAVTRGSNSKLFAVVCDVPTCHFLERLQNNSFSQMHRWDGNISGEIYFPRNVATYLQTTRRHISETRNLNIYRRENLRSQVHPHFITVLLLN